MITIALEGIDGSGKTSLIPRVVEFIKDIRPRQSVTSVGLPSPALRQELAKLPPAAIRFSGSALILAHMFSRDYDDTIKALGESCDVLVTDRSPLSLLVYQQPHLRKHLDAFSDCGQLASSRMPDLTILLEINPLHALRRIADRNEKKDSLAKVNECRFELEKKRIDYHAALLRGKHVAVVMSDDDSEVTFRRITNAIQEFFAKRDFIEQPTVAGAAVYDRRDELLVCADALACEQVFQPGCVSTCLQVDMPRMDEALSAVYIPRSHAETDTSLRQFVAGAVVVYEPDMKLLCFRRAGKEGRLTGSLSCIFGGHVEYADMRESALRKPGISHGIAAAMRREVSEELSPELQSCLTRSQKMYRIMTSDNPVSQVHIGFVRKLVVSPSAAMTNSMLNNPNLAVSESETADAVWLSLDELLQAENVETWTALLAQSLKEDLVP